MFYGLKRVIFFIKDDLAGFRLWDFLIIRVFSFSYSFLNRTILEVKDWSLAKLESSPLGEELKVNRGDYSSPLS